MEREISARFRPPSIRAVRGYYAGEAKQNYFCGRKRILLCLGSFLCGDLVSAAQEGAGGMRGEYFLEFIYAYLGINL